MQKNSEGVSTHGDGLVASIKRFMQSAVETIKTKYKTFLKTDKKSNMFNTVGDAGFIHKNIASKEVVLTPDNDKVLVKTEISCSKERSPYLGSAQKYMPKVEFCNGNKTYNDEIIDDDFTLNETEWCH